MASKKPVKFVGATLWRIWRSVLDVALIALKNVRARPFLETLALYLREISRIMTMSGDFASHLAVPLVNEEP